MENHIMEFVAHLRNYSPDLAHIQFYLYNYAFYLHFQFYEYQMKFDPFYCCLYKFLEIETFNSFDTL